MALLRHLFILCAPLSLHRLGRGFLAVLIIALLIDAVAYACYLFFLSKAEENMGKLWFAFILAYVLASSDKLAIVWQMLAANAGTH